MVDFKASYCLFGPVQVTGLSFFMHWKSHTGLFCSIFIFIIRYYYHLNFSYINVTIYYFSCLRRDGYHSRRWFQQDLYLENV